MNENELIDLLKRSCAAMNLTECVRVLTEFKSTGGSQESACNMLHHLSTNEILDDDFVLSLMDVVSGWCQPHQRIWNTSIQTEVLLYTIQEIERREGQLGLLPGVSQALIKNCGLGEVRQGAIIELRSPDGSVRATPIINYYVQVLNVPGEEFAVDDAPVVICVSDNVEASTTSIGTEVWIRK